MRFASLFDPGSNPGAVLFGRLEFFEPNYKNESTAGEIFLILLLRGGSVSRLWPFVSEAKERSKRV